MSPDPLILIKIRKPPVFRNGSGEKVTGKKIVVGRDGNGLVGGFVVNRRIPGFGPQVIYRDGRYSFPHSARVSAIDLRAGIICFSGAKVAGIAIRNMTVINNVQSGRVEEVTGRWRVLRANSNTHANGSRRFAFLTWPRGSLRHQDVPNNPQLVFPSPKDGKFRVKYLVEDEELIQQVGGFVVGVLGAGG